MKAVVVTFNQEKALVGAFSVITNLRMERFEALLHTVTLPRPGTSLITDGEREPFIWFKLMPSCQLGRTIRQRQWPGTCLNGGEPVDTGRWTDG